MRADPGFADYITGADLLGESIPPLEARPAAPRIETPFAF